MSDWEDRQGKTEAEETLGMMRVAAFAMLASAAVFIGLAVLVWQAIA